jgi:hypothetical protein
MDAGNESGFVWFLIYLFYHFVFSMPHKLIGAWLLAKFGYRPNSNLNMTRQLDYALGSLAVTGGLLAVLVTISSDYKLGKPNMTIMLINFLHSAIEEPAILAIEYSYDLILELRGGIPLLNSRDAYEITHNAKNSSLCSMIAQESEAKIQSKITEGEEHSGSGKAACRQCSARCCHRIFVFIAATAFWVGLLFVMMPGYGVYIT